MNTTNDKWHFAAFPISFCHNCRDSIKIHLDESVILPLPCNGCNLTSIGSHLTSIGSHVRVAATLTQVSSYKALERGNGYIVSIKLTNDARRLLLKAIKQN